MVSYSACGGWLALHPKIGNGLVQIMLAGPLSFIGIFLIRDLIKGQIQKKGWVAYAGFLKTVPIVVIDLVALCLVHNSPVPAPGIDCRVLPSVNVRMDAFTAIDVKRTIVHSSKGGAATIFVESDEIRAGDRRFRLTCNLSWQPSIAGHPYCAWIPLHSELQIRYQPGPIDRAIEIRRIGASGNS